MGLTNFENGLVIITVIVYAVFIVSFARRSRRSASRLQALEDTNARLVETLERVSAENSHLRERERKRQAERKKASGMPVSTGIANRMLPDLKAENINQEGRNKFAIDPSEKAAMVAEIDRYYGNFTIRLAAAYPSLKDNDLTTCCLVLLKVKAKNIPLLMGETYSASSKRRKRLALLFDTDNLYLFVEDFANNQTL